MNNPNEILVSFGNEQNKYEIQQSHSEVNSTKEIINDEAQITYLLYRFDENFKKGAYKKTIKEIDTILNEQNLDGLNKSWKIYMIKIRAQLKVIKKKMDKYLIRIDIEKMKTKYKISSIKRYLNQVLENLNNLVEKISMSKKDDIIEEVDHLLCYYFEYIYLCCVFNKKIGNTINTISYLSILLDFYNKTKLICKQGKTLYYLGNCFILLCQMFLSNKDFISSMNYINITIKICFNNLVYNVKDFSDGVFKDDKKRELKIQIKRDKDDSIFSQKELDIELEKAYGDKNTKRIIQQLIILFYYRGICYENMGKINFAVKAYSQCIWFITNFFYKSSEKILPLFQNTFDKSVELKKFIVFVNRKIKLYERMQIIWKKQYENKQKEEEKKRLVYGGVPNTKRLKILENKILNLDIKEVDTINPFYVKKNVEEINGRKRDGVYKYIFLYDHRLLNSYLREEFRPIIDSMKKIRTLDINLIEREKIQNVLRGIYFDEKAKKMKQKNQNNTFKRNCTTNIHNNKLSRTSIVFHDGNRNTLSYKKNHIINSYSDITNNNTNERNILSSPTNQFTKISSNINNYSKISVPIPTKKVLMSKSSISDKRIISSKMNEKRRIFSPISSKGNNYDFKNKTFMVQNDLRKSKYTSQEIYKKIRTQSAILYKKIPTEDKELNHFFSKQYLRKRKYIKMLEDRDLKFQKFMLKIKKEQNQNNITNKGEMKQKADELFNRVIGTHITIPPSLEKITFLDKKLKQEEKLESSIISSLDKSAIIKYNIQKNKERNKSKKMSDRMVAHMKSVNAINNNAIKDIDKKLEEINQREYIQNKNYQEIINQNNKVLKLNLNLMKGNKVKNPNISPIHRYSSVFRYENKNDEYFFYNSNKY